MSRTQNPNPLLRRWATRHPLRVVVAALIVGIGAVACSAPEEVVTSEVSTLDAPQRIVAGEAIGVVVEASGSGPIELDVIDAFSTTTLTVEADRRDPDGRIRFDVPGHLTRASGVVTFRAVGGVGDDVATSTLIVPAGAVDPLDVVVGPRTVVADGADETMAIGFVTDEFGNPLLDGTTVPLTLIGERADTVTVDAVLEGGVAARLIGSGTIAQRVEVYASVDDARLASRRVDYHEVPGPAAAVDVVLAAGADERLVADGRTLLDVRTAPLFDQHGNLLIDGRLVRLETDGPDGIGQLTARTIDGIARFDVVAPSRAGSMTLRADVDGVSSSGIVIEYGPAVTALPVDLVTAPDGITVSIGLVRDDRGAVVVDGTNASITLGSRAADSDGADGAVAVLATNEVQLIDGRAQVAFDASVLEQLEPGTVVVDVTVLGVTTTVEPT